MTTPRRDGTQQTEFGRWMYKNPRIDSIKAALSITDIDWIVHQYKDCTDAGGERLIQNLLFIEVKTFCKEPPFAQLDTLRVVNKIMVRNWQNYRPAVHRIWHNGKRVTVRNYGFHLLTFSQTNPLDSEHMWWDKKDITAKTLELILRFEVSPKTLRPRDPSERRHHGGAKQLKLDLQPVMCGTCDEFICTCRRYPEDRTDPQANDVPEISDE